MDKEDEITNLVHEYFEDKIPIILKLITSYFYDEKNLNNPIFLSFMRYDYHNFKSIILDLLETFDWKLLKIKLDEEEREKAIQTQINKDN